MNNDNNRSKRKPFTMATKHEDLELEPFSMGSFAEIIGSIPKHIHINTFQTIQPGTEAHRSAKTPTPTPNWVRHLY